MYQLIYQKYCILTRVLTLKCIILKGIIIFLLPSPIPSSPFSSLSNLIVISRGNDLSKYEPNWFLIWSLQMINFKIYFLLSKFRTESYCPTRSRHLVIKVSEITLVRRKKKKALRGPPGLTLDALRSFFKFINFTISGNSLCFTLIYLCIGSGCKVQESMHMPWILAFIIQIVWAM